MPVASIQYPDDIVNRNNNGGWHRNGKRAYRKAVQGLLRFLQTAKEARLYHLCFEELDELPDSTDERSPHERNMAMLHAFRQMAERDGIRCEWWAAREIADSSKKDHLHAFMVIDAFDIKVAKLFNTFEDGRIQQHCKTHGVEFNIFEPKDYQGIHGRNKYMALPYQGPGNRQTALAGERLADALVWLSYLGKARSKPEDDKSGQIFPASRPGRKAAPQAAHEALDTQAATQATPFHPIGFPMGRVNHILTEKASNEEITTPQCGTEGQSTGTSPGDRETTSRANHCAVHDCGTGQSGGRTSTSDSRYSRYSSPGAEAIHPGCQDDGPADWKPEAVQRGQSNGRASSQGCDTRQPITHSPGGTTVLTTAQKYIASRYEQAVGLRLDLDEVRAYLLAHGIKRTPAQVVHELDEVYEFYGYASSHPAPPASTLAAIDKSISRQFAQNRRLAPEAA
jgi:hypothetical protein